MGELAFIEDVLKGIRAYVLENYEKRRTIEVDEKAHANDVLTAVDLGVQERIVEKIRSKFPDDLILAEEGDLSVHPDSPPDRCWVIDPIDGTQNFLRGFFPAFGVTMAYIEKGESTAGGVILPVNGDLFLAERGGGASRNGEKIVVSDINDLQRARFDIDFDGPSLRKGTIEMTLKLMENVGQIRSYACAVIGFCQIAAGEEEGYIHLGLNPWDHAAGQVILEEAGGSISRLDGERLKPFDGKLGALASNGVIHEQLLVGLDQTAQVRS